jgi:[acyl-carrier-protein] S-malonyltransferase
MAKVAFIYPGQGSQKVGMGKELSERYPEAKAVFDAADDALGSPLSKLCFEGPDESLKLTANTQPAILTVSVAAHAVLAKRTKAPAFVAGHSLGEWSALVCVGAMALPDAVRAVRSRGAWMQEAVPEGQGAMAAVLGLAPDKVREVCEAQANGQVLTPANYNSPEQTVIAGHATAVERAAGPLKEAGAKRVMPLPVSAPFHCPMMDPVKPKLADVLTAMALQAFSIPVVSSVTGQPNSDVKRVATLLVDQVSAPVRWLECVEELVRQGVTHVVELGPGKVLGGLARRIHKDLEVLNVEDVASLEKTVAVLEAL